MLKHYKPSHADWLAGHWEERDGHEVWRPALPRIPDILAKTVFYIYENEDDAREGYTDSATGFLFGVPSDIFPNRYHVYAITNWHVVNQIKTPTLRINTLQGGFDVIRTEQDEWKPRESNCDLMYRSIELDDGKHDTWFFDSDYLMTKEFMFEQQIGAGDEVLMIGNFQTRGGKAKNLPTIRSGNIAQMPDEPMKNPYTGYDEESFVVEMRSASGYSGSPVILSLLGSRRFYVKNEIHGARPRYGTMEVQDDFKLLGIDWGHIATKEFLYDGDGNKLPRSESVWINSAMAGVVPCWKLEEMIFSEEEIEMRKKKDEKRQKRIDQSQIRVDFEKEGKDRELTKEEFEDALRKIARPLKPDDPKKKGT